MFELVKTMELLRLCLKNVLSGLVYLISLKDRRGTRDALVLSTAALVVLGKSIPVHSL